MRRLTVVIAALILLLAGRVQTQKANAQSNSAIALPDESLFADPVFARPGYADLADPFLNKTRYLLALNFDFASAQLDGQARILFVNSTPDALDKVVLRLYPNHPWYSVHNGIFSPRATVSSVTVDGSAVTTMFGDAWQTVLNVPLATPMPPGGKATLDITYQLHAAAPGNILAELEPFPMLAVYDNGTWREDVPTKGLDYVYSEAALYVIHLHTSPGVEVVSTGVIKDRQDSLQGVDYTIVTGPVRDFVFVVTKDWQEFDADSIVPIRVHYAGRDAAAAQNIGHITAAAMRFYESQYGVYPYAKLDIIAMPFESGGEEYPTLIFCNTDGSVQYHEFITAHETAHQWFYGVAGDDIVRHAWLDESLAQISGYLFTKNAYGPIYAVINYWPHILNWTRGVSTPRLIDTSLDNFPTSEAYMQTIYGAGAVFMRDLSEKIGEQQFIAGLWEYYHAAFLAVGTPQQFFESMQAQTPIDLAPIFCQRMGIMCR